ncbi:heparinase II/III family protein [Nonomuraea aridisoli]|uniref:Uncharacterized protein n=1 Tax=Nonomuraea aridisoli TaxID=2070368 RepID=A0A2W2EK03_9ACTN|nr:heparinase II/III family protein [Nonomuraea aridisoli]PZG22653.1 hypothetical protein C1J01_03225 [Nonomuraea aridisoli]
MTYVEKPPHVHETRMRHISDEDLLAALGAATVAETRHWRRPKPLWDLGRDDVAAADALIGQEVDFLDRSRGRSRLYGFHYLRWMMPLVSAYARTGDPVYAKEWDRLFTRWYDTRDQVEGDWPGLDVVWYSLGVWARSMHVNAALAVFAEEPALGDGCWTRMLKTVIGGARWAAEEHDTFRHGNWQFVCACELLHAATLYPELPEAASWAEVARARVFDHLERDVRADGGHHERSPGYHVMVLESLQRAVALDPRIGEHPKVAAMHAWLAALEAPGGWVPHLQDSGVVWPAELLAKGPKVAVPDGSCLLPASAYAVMRGAGRYAVVNYGPYVGHELEPHSHHAALDFVLADRDGPLAWEAGGPPSYDDPGYYDWYQATRGHNTLLVPGQDYTEDRRAELDLFVTGEHADVFAGHHHGYAQRHDRRIVFVHDEPSYWLVTDTIDAEAIWQLHGLEPWRPHGSGHVSGRLLVVPSAPPDEILHGNGPARIPDQRTRTAEYGEIHLLGLRRRDGRFTVAIVPFHGEPPEVSVTESRVTIDGTTDTFTAYGWSRGESSQHWGGDE